LVLAGDLVPAGTMLVTPAIDRLRVMAQKPEKMLQKIMNE